MRFPLLHLGVRRHHPRLGDCQGSRAGIQGRCLCGQLGIDLVELGLGLFEARPCVLQRNVGHDFPLKEFKLAFQIPLG